MSDKMMMIALLLAAAVLIIIIVVVLLSEIFRKDNDEYEDSDDDGDDEDDEQEYQSSHHRKQKQHADGGRQQRPVEKPVEKPLQWKLLLENLNTWEKFSIVFYKNIGIGRVENREEFEKYLTVTDDGRVSKVHCEIFRKKDSLYLRDSNSRNGTYLNGERIDGPVMIQKDDVIGIGATKIEVTRVLRERD